jgi:hypothetical protein
MTKAEHERFDVLNKIHPKKRSPQENYEFYLLLGKGYLGEAYRKSKKPQSDKVWRREQGYYALMKAGKIRAEHKLKEIPIDSEIKGKDSSSGWWF